MSEELLKMYDSVNPANITDDKYIAAYFNGRFAWPRNQINRHPGHILIAVKPDQPEQAIWARALDIERFDATPGDAVPFVRTRLAHNHRDATLYVNRSNRDEVVADLTKAGFVLGKQYRLWVATLDGTRTLPDMTGVWAVQYQGGFQAPFDISEIHGVHDFTPPTK